MAAMGRSISIRPRVFESTVIQDAQVYLHGFAPVLEWVARSSGRVCSADLVRSVVSRTVAEQILPEGKALDQRQSTPGGIEVWATLFAKAAGSLQLRTRHHDAVASHALRALQDETSVVTYLSGREEDCAWLAISKISRSRFSVMFRGPRKERRMKMSHKQLVRFIGRVAGNVALPWMYVEPLFAMRAIGGVLTEEPGLKPIQPWARLRALVRLEKNGLWILFTHALVTGLLTLVTPVAIQALVNTVAFGSLLQPLFVLTMLLFGGLSFRAVIQAHSVWATEMLQRRIFVRMTEDLGERISRIHFDAYRTRNLPEMMLRFFDVMTVQKSISGLILDGLGLILQLTVGLALLAFYHPLLLLFDIVLIIFLSSVVMMFARQAMRTAVDESYAKFNTAGWLHNLVSQPLLFRSSGGQNYASTRSQALCRDYLDARHEHFRRLIRQFIGGFGLQVFAMVSLLGMGGFLVINRQLTLGQLVAAELVIGVTAVGFSKLGKHLEKMYDLLAGLDKLGTLIDLPIEHSGRELPITSGAATLEIENLRTHRGAGGPALDIPYLRVGPRESIALSGVSGSGKSTLLDLIWGVRESYDGSLRIDGLEEKLADVSSWRDCVYLIRGTEFIDGTVWDNLTLGNLALRKEAVQFVLEAVGLDERIRLFPKGLDTRLLPSGAPLSSTEKHLFVLARALLQHPRLVLIDGILDYLNLSPQNKQRVLYSVLGPETPWTAIVASADPEVLSYCSRHLRLEDGYLSEQPLSETSTERVGLQLPPGSNDGGKSS